MGAACYTQAIAHPPGKKVEWADVAQLVYLGAAPDRVLATAEVGFRSLAKSILSGRYRLAEAVSLDEMTAP